MKKPPNAPVVAPERKRNTLHSRIKSAPDTDAAIEVAKFGRTLTPIERATLQYLTFGGANAGGTFRQVLPMNAAPKYRTINPGDDFIANKVKAELAELVFRAVDSAAFKPDRRPRNEVLAERMDRHRHPKKFTESDKAALATYLAELKRSGAALREMAAFVEYWGTRNPFGVADKKRLAILNRKQISECGVPEIVNELTVDELANSLKMPPPSYDDGNSTLRKLCKELGFQPTKSDKVIKLKKSSSKPVTSR